MKEYTVLKVSVQDGVATIVINNPPANVLTIKAFSELLDAITSLNSNPEVRAIILTAEGNIFAAGADISKIDEIKTMSEGEALCQEVQKLTLIMENSSVPIIAAVNGMCLGGGNELVMSCHIRVASDRARFGQPEINLGIMPGAGGTQRLPRIIPKGKAFQMLLTGDIISAQEAKTIGLVDILVPDAELQKYSTDIAKKIASKSRQAVSRIVKAVQEGLKLGLEEGLKLEARLFGEIVETEDKNEGIRAFREKRQPRFTHK